MRDLFIILLFLCTAVAAGAQTSIDSLSKTEKRELFESIRAKSYMFSIMAGVNMRQERFTVPLLYESAFAGPGQHFQVALSRNRYNSFTKVHLDYNSFMEHYKRADENAVGETSAQVPGIGTFTLGLSRGTYLREFTDGDRVLSLEGGINVSFSNFESSVNTFIKDEVNNGIVFINGYSRRVFPLVHLGIGTSIRISKNTYWDISATYYQGLLRMYQYSYDFRDWNGLNGFTEHVNNGSYLALKTGINLALAQ